MVERFGAEEAKALGSGGQLNPPWVELLMGWPMGWTKIGETNETSERSTDKIVSSLRGNNDSTPLEERETRQHIRGSKILQSYLRWLSDNGITGEREKTGTENGAHGFLFQMPFQQRTTATPPGQKPNEQQPGERGNFVPEMSHVRTHGGRDVGPWGEGWEDGTTRIAKNVSHRTDRLKAIGNGQVPQVAELAFRTLYSRLIG
jgi:hypothetical protein